MISKMATVRVAKAANTKNMPNPPAKLFALRPTRITMDQRTSESSVMRKTGRMITDQQGPQLWRRGIACLPSL